jgi:hypothetical protein
MLLILLEEDTAPLAVNLLVDRSPEIQYGPREEA